MNVVRFVHAFVALFTLFRLECGHTPSSPLSCNFANFDDDFDDDGQLDSIAPYPTARRSRNHRRSLQSCMTKVTRVCGVYILGGTEYS